MSSLVSMQLEAIILKNFDYQDHHKIAKMISPSHGLISVFVSYANKKKSRYQVLAEPLTRVMIHVKAPRAEQEGLYYLVYGDIVNSYYELKGDFELVMMFYEMVKIIIRGDIDMYHLPYVYRLLRDVLEVEMVDVKKFKFGVLAFKAKMLAVLGILPAIDSCVACRQTSKIVTASVSEGGLVCADCYAGDGIWLAVDLITLWRALFKVPIKRLITLDIKNSEVMAFETWIKSYYERYSNIKIEKRLEI